MHRAKPSVPFAGKYRIIDFTLSNCLHSGLRRVLVLTQYKSHSLHKHIRDGWSIFNPELGEFITCVPPQMRSADNVYVGTADALFQNYYLLERSGAEYVVILAGDHIYRMDYAAMLQSHVYHNASLSIACMRVPLRDAAHFGVITYDAEQRIVGFQEKPKQVTPMAGDNEHAMASMGVYIFSTAALNKALTTDHDDGSSEHDFGKNIIPRMIDKGGVYAYAFGELRGRVSLDKYWRDVGTIDAYYRANMDLLISNPPIDLYQGDWCIRTYSGQYPPARTSPGNSGGEGIFINSIVASGSIIAGGSVQGSVLFNNVLVDDEARVQGAILFSGVHVGKGSHLRNCIVDKDVHVPPGTRIGFDLAQDANRFHISENNIVVVPKAYRF